MKATLEFNLPGKGLKSLSVGGILPNGSFVDPGLYFGKKSLRVSRKKLLWYFKEWNAYERKNGLKPGDIVPGLILFGTVKEGNQSYSIVSSVILNPGKVPGGYSVKVAVRGELIPMGKIPMVMPGGSNDIPDSHKCAITEQDSSWSYY